jgi:hypothetical protein
VLERLRGEWVAGTPRSDAPPAGRAAPVVSTAVIGAVTLGAFLVVLGVSLW